MYIQNTESLSCTPETLNSTILYFKFYLLYFFIIYYTFILNFKKSSPKKSYT